MEDQPNLEVLNSIYLDVIMRYKSYIEEQEHLSVSELPTLVTPKSPMVVLKAGSIKEALEPYSFDHDFYEASVRAYEFVNEEIQAIRLPIEFWLYPDDVIKLGAGDVMDKNVLLCSLLVALGNPSSKVIVSFGDASNVIANYYELNGSFYRLSIGEGLKSYASKEQLMLSLGIDKDSTAYEFNDQLYLDIN
jgi:hypothetical protein